MFHNGQFSGTLLGITRGREGDEPVFGQVDRAITGEFTYISICIV